MWIVRDQFIKDADNELKSIKFTVVKSQRVDALPFYMIDFYNVKSFSNTSTSVDFAATHILNALTEAINKEQSLPKYLLVILDQDIIFDVDVFSSNSGFLVSEMTRWFIQQVDTIIRRKSVDLLKKKLGSLSGYCTTIIFVRMLQRIGHFDERSRMFQAALLRV